jgi:hypothetical protein
MRPGKRQSGLRYYCELTAVGNIIALTAALLRPVADTCQGISFGQCLPLPYSEVCVFVAVSV